MFFIPYEDQPETCFFLRSLCKASKQAVDNIYIRFYVPHLKAIVVGIDMTGYLTKDRLDT